ncbi:MAG: hypothetical protein J5835_02990 [Bacteroidales bacterium]|nr:hypothetical protein [Bacteroidales bacterium]
MKRLIWICFIALAATAALSGCREDGPEQDEKEETVDMFGDDLFIKYTDPEFGVISYKFRNEALGLGKCNTQSNYFVTKSMTDDERFFFMFYSAKEQNGNKPSKRGAFVVDLKKRKLIQFYASDSCYPYLDIKEDKLYYYLMDNSRDGGHFMMKDLLKGTTTQLADFPKELATTGSYITRCCSHITLTRDRRKVFLDAIVNDTFYQGLLDLYTGEWTEWSHNETVHLTHGQINPTRDDEALLAIDAYHSSKKDLPIVNDPDGTFPRIQIMTSDGNRRTIKPSEGNYATHEMWLPDGNTVSFSAGMDNPDWTMTGGFHTRNIRTGAYTATNVGRATHCNFSNNMKYVVHDDDRPWGSYQEGFYRGGPWRVWFYNRETKKDILIYSGLKPITSSDKPSTIHPDPHPHFVCNDKYIICSASDDEVGENGYGYLHFSITPVDQLIKLTK